jgi:hypothetical protein
MVGNAVTAPMIASFVEGLQLNWLIITYFSGEQRFPA